MSEEKRRAVFESVQDKARKAGLELENDPVFLKGIERWIIGEIDIATLRGDYLDLLVRREDSAWLKHQSNKGKR